MHKAPFKPSAEDLGCECGGRRVLPSQAKPRKPLRRVSEKNAPKVHKRGSTLKQGRGFQASPEQQARVRDEGCLICGRDRHEAQIHAAHVYPRRLASCTCADGVVALCSEHHRAYDEDKLDLLPALITHGRRLEIVHAFLEHDAPLIDVLDCVTGEKWEPRSCNSGATQ